VAFLWRHRGLALRDCDDCEKYVFNADGTMYRDKSGRPIPVRSRRVGICGRQPCGSRSAKPILESWHAEILELWRACRDYHALPRAGGIADQDWFLMRLFRDLDALRAEIDDEKREDYVREHARTHRRGSK